MGLLKSIYIYDILTTMFNTTIKGTNYTLEYFNETSHKTGLYDAANNPILWTGIKSNDQSLSTFLQHYIQTMIDKHKTGDPIAYTIINNESKQIVGSSRYYEISETDKKLCIGFTWYQPELWGSGINPEVKLLLLGQIFDDLNWNRVGFHVDTRNTRSISAMTYLGAVNEGTLRKHKIVQGDFARDTVQFGITNDEWPTVKSKLLRRLL